MEYRGWKGHSFFKLHTAHWKGTIGQSNGKWGRRVERENREPNGKGTQEGMDRGP